MISLLGAKRPQQIPCPLCATWQFAPLEALTLLDIWRQAIQQDLLSRYSFSLSQKYIFTNMCNGQERFSLV